MNKPLTSMFATAALVLSAGVSVSVQAADPALMLDVTLERQSATESGVSNKRSVTFSVLVDFNQRATISPSQDWTLGVLAKDGGEQADLDLVLYAKDGDRFGPSASKHLLAPLQAPSSYQWTSSDGERYMVTITPSKASRPAHS